MCPICKNCSFFVLTLSFKGLDRQCDKIDKNEKDFLLKQPLLAAVNDHLIDYPTPANLSYWWVLFNCWNLFNCTNFNWNFSLMHYTPHIDLAFLSVEHIMRDVEGGWFLRYMHANGASMFFIVVYLHLLRAYITGVILVQESLFGLLGLLFFFLMILTAFIGYVLPWGQMSFGATVITSLASAIPVVGTDITHWLWGGFSVDNATLNRFFSLHYLLPFIIAGASLVHIVALHQYGSNNPLGCSATVDKSVFYPYLLLKDLVGWVVFAIFFLGLFILHLML